MKDILTESELRFLRSQGLGPDDVMDVRHMSQWHWFQRIKEEGKSIALGSNAERQATGLGPPRATVFSATPRF
jgi:hypothetical protein